MSANRSSADEDGFDEALTQRFDGLVANMQRLGFRKAIQKALFSGPDLLIQKNYRPGETETKPQK